MKEVSKAAKRHFRELTAVAHERELNKALAALSAHCDCWKKGELDAFALNEEIHKYHQGISRDLYTFYSYREPSHLVASAIVSGVLNEKEVNTRYLPLLESLIEFFRQQR